MYYITFSSSGIFIVPKFADTIPSLEIRQLKHGIRDERHAGDVITALSRHRLGTLGTSPLIV
jgi:hypothetical protein